MNVKIELLNRARLFWRTLTVAFVCALFFCEAQAQVGDDSADGVAGSLSGIITTGCGYNAYTGNVTRSITDIAVVGSVGKYPLALTRTYSSRGYFSFAFGNPSAWQHSYVWGVGSGTSVGAPVTPTYYGVSFPDGRTETFTQQGSEWKAAAGTSERFIPFTGVPNSAHCYLLLPDGGKVDFLATQQHDNDQPVHYWYDYQVQTITDPYGQATTFTYDPNTGKLSRVTEPGGQYLQFSYNANGFVSSVSSSAGRTVTYGYQQFGVAGNWELITATYDNLPQFTAHYNYSTTYGSIPWLWTADEPRYPGPMKRIAYVYKTGTNADGSPAAPGQIQSELYWDGQSGDENVGPAVSTLEVGTGGNPLVRKETRFDGKTRTFTYIVGGYLTNMTDFMGHGSSQVVDPTTKFVTSVTDANLHTTNFTRDALGHVLQTTFPASAAVTPSPAPRGTAVVAYEANGYYVHSVQDEAQNVTTFLRDSNHRVYEIDYADGGIEAFSYDSLGRVASHQLRTGGSETFSYDGSTSRILYYSDAYHSNPNNPSISYLYEPWGRVQVVVNAEGTPTYIFYDDVNNIVTTQFFADPVDGQAHTIVQNFNADGTLQQVTDQLGHVTSYTYDDYRRLKSVTTPQRAQGDNTARTYYLYYDANGTGDDYQYTDSNVTWLKLPSTKKVKTDYDDNRRTWKVTLAPGVNLEESVTRYEYDNAGNVIKVYDPKNNYSTWSYDERNRLMRTTDRTQQVTGTILYDPQGHQKQVTRANGQTTTFDSFDAGNRVTQKTVSQSPNPAAVTQYTYYGANGPTGLLQYMKDPHLVGANSSESYSYAYDSMGRPLTMGYPRPNPSATPTGEAWHYDTMGRVDQLTTRAGKHLVSTFDILGRLTQTAWDDNGVTPTVTYGYDVASRLTSISNVNSTVTRTYFDDDLLKSETQAVAGASPQKLNYTYDADANRASLIYPAGGNSYTATYGYTNRDELRTVGTNATWAYDVNGNLLTRTLVNNTTTTYTVDALDRVTNITHALNGTTRTLDYDYDSVGNRKWTKRDAAITGNGDVFSYDLADQVDAVKLDIAHPDTTPAPAQSIWYDAGGNRSVVSVDGIFNSYGVNNLNQYTTRIIPGQPIATAAYDTKGNMTTGLDASTYTFDAQNRILTATKSRVTNSFTYDGLGRQVTRTVGSGISVTTTVNIYDGWNLIEERDTTGATLQAQYVYGPEGLFLSGNTGRSQYWTYHYQNGEGSASHIADNQGNLLEWYRYDLQGTPVFYNANDQQIAASAYLVRHLFAGEQWYSGLKLYDLRNRFYSPDIGRFIQPDPIGFAGGDNLYRHCRNNPIKWGDPFGLDPNDEVRIHQTEDEHTMTQDELPEGASATYGSGIGNDYKGVSTVAQQTYYDANGNVIGTGNSTGNGTNGIGSSTAGMGPGGTGSAGTIGWGGFASNYGGSLGGIGTGPGERRGDAAGTGPSRQSHDGRGSNTPTIFSSSGSGWGQMTVRDIYDFDSQRKFARQFGREFRKLDLDSFATGFDRFALGASIVVTGGAVIELAGPVLAAGPGAIGESVQSAIYSGQLTATKVLIGAQVITMTTITANINNPRVLELLEEEVVEWRH